MNSVELIFQPVPMLLDRVDEKRVVRITSVPSARKKNRHLRHLQPKIELTLHRCGPREQASSVWLLVGVSNRCHPGPCARDPWGSGYRAPSFHVIPACGAKRSRPGPSQASAKWIVRPWPQHGRLPRVRAAVDWVPALRRDDVSGCCGSATTAERSRSSFHVIPACGAKRSRPGPSQASAKWIVRPWPQHGRLPRCSSRCPLTGSRPAPG